MRNIYYTKKDINKWQEIANGTKARIYKKDENTVIKLYRENIDVFPNAFLFADSGILEKANVILPKEKIYIGKELKGYTMKLVKGFTLENVKIDNSLQNQAYKDMQMISEEGIVVRDLTIFNMMYSQEERKLKFIDIDHWCRKEQLSTVYLDINGKIDSVCVEKEKLKNKEARFLFDIEGNFIPYSCIVEVNNDIEIEKIKERNKTMLKRILK